MAVEREPAPPDDFRMGSRSVGEEGVFRVPDTRSEVSVSERKREEGG